MSALRRTCEDDLGELPEVALFARGTSGNGLEALIVRPVYYELAELAIADGSDSPELWSDGACFPLGRAL